MCDPDDDDQPKEDKDKDKERQKALELERLMRAKGDGAPVNPDDIGEE